MQEDPVIARETARMLLEVGAVHFRADPPFTLTSGRVSPVYIDCRRLLGFPRVRRALTDFAVTTLQQGAGYEVFDAVAGGETAGIPFAALLADRLGLPMSYIRKQAKGFGRNARIEGREVEGNRTLLVEDLATDAGSKVSFIDGLREAGATVEHAFVVFHYGIFPESTRALSEKGVKLHALATWHDVLAEAENQEALSPDTLEAVRGFLYDPHGWSRAQGGA